MREKKKKGVLYLYFYVQMVEFAPFPGEANGAHKHRRVQAEAMHGL
jgi:hypothetical protein